jgi:hypothetical protein
VTWILRRVKHSVGQRVRMCIQAEDRWFCCCKISVQHKNVSLKIARLCVVGSWISYAHNSIAVFKIGPAFVRCVWFGMTSGTSSWNIHIKLWNAFYVVMFHLSYSGKHLVFPRGYSIFCKATVSENNNVSTRAY